MNNVSFARLAAVIVIAFATGFTASMSDGFSSFTGGDFTALGRALEANASKAVAVGLSAALTSAIGFLTIPFKGLPLNALAYKEKAVKGDE